MLVLCLPMSVDYEMKYNTYVFDTESDRLLFSVCVS